jgi:glycosyltransferase involved in cell wall biosynthesis
MIVGNHPMNQSPFAVKTPFQTNIAPQQMQSGTKQPQPPEQPPEAGLPRFLNYYADYSGCGHWRMIWPEQVMNAHSKAVVHGSTVMNVDPRYYVDVKGVRIQRQATPQQLEFVKWLRQLADKEGFRLIYEIDDICFSEDIPDYNKYKTAFTDPAIRKSAQEMMAMCDEITVTCPFMRDYYREKTGNKNVTVIPNFMPKFWIDRFYDHNRTMESFEKNKRKPRILYAGSGAHFDVENRVKQRDDFHHVVQVIANTVDEFQWVFLGAFPLSLRPLVDAGKIEFHPWRRLFEYGKGIYDLNVNMMVAPLEDNIFNRSKSDLKHIEACAFGVPIACQDMCTYENAPIKFKTGDEMVDQIRRTLSDRKRYKALCRKGRQYAEMRWLEDDRNIDCYTELYQYGVDDPKRVNIGRYNLN